MQVARTGKNFPGAAALLALISHHLISPPSGYLSLPASALLHSRSAAEVLGPGRRASNSRGMSEVPTLDEHERNLRCPFSRSPSFNPLRGRPRWVPTPRKYLLMTCLGGRISNQMFCMRSSLALAALLNRSLLVPPVNSIVSQGYMTYDTGSLVDWKRMQLCLGPGKVTTFTEYFKRRKAAAVEVKGIHCYFDSRNKCFKSRGLTHLRHDLRGALALPNFGESGNWVHASRVCRTDNNSCQTPTGKDVVKAFGSLSDDVLCVGELFGAFVPAPPELSASPICRNLWRPPADVMAFVWGFTRHILNCSFVSVHLRRGDFYKYMRKKGGDQKRFGSAAELVNTMGKHLSSLSLTVQNIYVSTDAGAVESTVFSSILRSRLERGSFVPAVFSVRQIKNTITEMGGKSWGAVLRRISWGQGDLFWTVVDKYIAAASSAFAGSASSSFSLDIISIRNQEGYNKQLSVLCSRGGCS